jgi:hypothetical protein
VEYGLLHLEANGVGRGGKKASLVLKDGWEIENVKKIYIMQLFN